ncbi:hypothetical protein NL108_015542 [Boleophthalmus pectinirostris]|nr:hypothetical protein NL108_015542 [Boleophthalmus pectinirostris]
MYFLFFPSRPSSPSLTLTTGACSSNPLSSLTACGLRCYTCTAAEPRSCTDTKSCPVIFNRCFSLITKGCQTSIACVGPMKCCEGDLCNGARQFTGPSFLLLFLSSTAILFFM